MSMNLDNHEFGVPKDASADEAPMDSGGSGGEASRQEAIKQIKRRRRFHTEFVVSGIGMVFLVLIWATSEYHNAGGWPTHGFSQSSGIHDVWNYWIIYPIGAWTLIMAGRAWSVYRHQGISESDIQREINRTHR
ncbi:MAG: 2TM domain-containing protein [Acidimicrobiales bacterium]